MRTRRAARSSIGAVVLLIAASAQAAERAPVAVLWVGPAAEDARGLQLVDGVYQALGKSTIARPIDTANLLNLQLQKMPSTEVEQHLAKAREHFGALRTADAAKEYEAAERVALDALPLAALQKYSPEIQRGLLAAYDQLGQRVEAIRAAERLAWVAGPEEPARALLEKYWHPQRYDAVFPPVEVTTEPKGAEVYRNGKLIGTSPVVLFGGDGAWDRLDLELPGYRSVRRPLGWSERRLEIVLEPETRLPVRLDTLRQSRLDASPVTVAALGKELGAERVLLVTLDGDKRDKVAARFIDVGKASAGAIVSVAPTELDKVAALGATVPVPAVAAAAAAKPAEKKSKWGKWYTWVAAGGVVLLVGGLLIAQNVGDDKFTVSVSK